MGFVSDHEARIEHLPYRAIVRFQPEDPLTSLQNISESSQYFARRFSQIRALAGRNAVFGRAHGEVIVRVEDTGIGIVRGWIVRNQVTIGQVSQYARPAGLPGGA